MYHVSWCWEKNHGVDHICDLPDFRAKKPFIHVNIVQDNNGDSKTDWDVQSCESFENEFGKWSKCNPGMELPV